MPYRIFRPRRRPRLRRPLTKIARITGTIVAWNCTYEKTSCSFVTYCIFRLQLCSIERPQTGAQSLFFSTRYPIGARGRGAGPATTGRRSERTTDKLPEQFGRTVGKYYPREVRISLQGQRDSFEGHQCFCLTRRSDIRLHGADR